MLKYVCLSLKSIPLVINLKNLKLTECLANPVMETSESYSLTTHSATSDSSVTALSIADELSDRERRKNLILYNVPGHTNRQSNKGFFVDLC